ncbi:MULTISPECIES: TetR/AcrR family transcriptional regulator [Streptomyces]|uniref:TetR family transcriptional regulator n=1 Tax=Streptomyces tsukubensis (strain DSM 42081 / NBRC 108919 / NRRL 18488 / 9993) TaxID=1114943 RepID=A0A7G3UPL7_STRT9|nr:TetR/AcrR family transcriptional regulator [Streptomyces tsukubensis]MYS64318.1 TetR family transcriptional regulator [Streptomyces sp. SID5473]QKM71349.1 TetR family transcriptional regulator [Streptomyces tsukubensis NRRL18488]TAI45317.1 TetR/AcrR family transcriptional regulator [Streptomyces tsukubensis]
MTEERARRRTGGRSARVRRAVLDATLQTMAEHGPDAVRIPEVARRAGVHETSVYRRWGTRERLVVDALLTYSQEQLHIPDTGTLRGDLVGFADSLAGYLDTPFGEALVRSMSAASDDQALAQSREEFWNTRFDLARVMIDRAVARGEIPEGTDPAFILETLIAPLHFRALLTRRPHDGHLSSRLVDLLLAGLTR